MTEGILLGQSEKQKHFHLHRFLWLFWKKSANLHGFHLIFQLNIRLKNWADKSYNNLYS